MKKMWRMLSMLLSMAMLMTSVGNVAYAVEGDYADVTITAEPATEITEVDGTVVLTATVTNATDTSVTWSADNKNVQIAEEEGNTLRVTGKVNGTTTITAISNEDTAAFDTVDITVSNQPNRKVDYDLDILFIGNSITKHPPAPTIGWNNDWGMAASSEENDFVHKLVSKIGDKYGEPDFSISGGAQTLESITAENTADERATSIAPLLTAVSEHQPEIVNIQVGENWGANKETKQAALQYFIDEAKKIKSDIVFNLCASFWGSTAEPDYLAKAAVAAANDNVYLSDTNIGTFNESDSKAENCAFGLFDHSGVAAHPGDKGMENIANIIFNTLDPVIESKFDAQYVICPESVTVQGGTITTENGTLQMSVSVLPEGASDKVEWSVDNENIATISAEGLLTAKNNGTVTVSAKSKYDASVIGTATVAVSNQSKCYTLTYSAGSTEGVTNLPSANEYAKGTTTFSDVIPERATYQFAGWSLTEGGQATDSVDITADTTVYAVWKQATSWEFDGRFDGITVENGFNVRITSGNLMAISNEMTADTLLTVKSPLLNIDPSKFNELTLAMKNSEINENTTVTLELTTASGTKTYQKPIKSTSKTGYVFDISDCTETITGFAIKPTNTDTTIIIDRISFGYKESTTEEGYYSVDLLDNKCYECDNVSLFGFNKSVDTTTYHDGGSSVKLSSTGYGSNWLNVDIDATAHPLNVGDTLNFSTWFKKELNTTFIDQELDKIALIYTITYKDSDGNEKVTAPYTIRHLDGNPHEGLLIDETEEWQYLSEDFVLAASEITDGCKITKVNITARFLLTQAGKLDGNVWFDQISIKRALPKGATLTQDYDEVGNSSYISGYNGYANAVITDEESYIGTKSYKYTGDGYNLLAFERYINKQIPTNKQNYKVSFYLKLNRDWLDLTGEPEPSKSVRIWVTTKYKGADGNEYTATNDGALVTVKDTTDWQLVEYTIEQELAEMAPSGGEIVMVTSSVRPRNGFHHTGFGNSPIYVDGYKVMMPENKIYVDTKLLSQDLTYKGNNKGVRLVFNDALVDETALKKASFVVNDNPCTDYTVEALEDGKTFDIFPASNESIRSFGVSGLVTAWGYNVDAKNVRDGVNQDSFFENIFPSNYYDGSGNVGSGYAYENDATGGVDGGSAVKLSDSSHYEIFGYTIDKDELKTLTDKLNLSFAIRKSANATAAGDLPITGYRVYVKAFYAGADGEDGFKEREYTVADYFGAESEDWYYPSYEFSLNDVKAMVPSDVEITGIRVAVRFNMGANGEFKGNVWLDKMSLVRVITDDYTTNMLTSTGYDCDDPTLVSSGYLGYSGAVADTTVFHDGTASVKLTGEGYNMIYREIYGQSISSNKQKFYLTFWMKKGEGVTDNNVLLWFNARTKAGDTYEQETFNISQLSVPIKDTTEWQRVSIPIDAIFTELPATGGALDCIWFFVRNGNQTGSLGEKEIWVDQFELYKAPPTDVYSKTRVDSQTAVAANGKIGSVEVEFNSDFVTLSALQGARVLADGNETAFTVSQSQDAKKATFTFANPIEFTTFEIKDLTDKWGNTVVTTKDVTLPEKEKSVTASVSFACRDTFEQTWSNEGCTIGNLVEFTAEWYDKFRAEVTVVNETDTDKTVDVVAVIRDGGRVVSVKKIADGITAPAGETVTDTTSLVFDNNLTETSEVTVYVWDSIESMKPIIPATSME